MRKKYAIKLIPRIYSYNDQSESVTNGITREVLADLKAIRYSEFYQAVASGFRPDATFVIWKDEYQDEERLMYNDNLYEVIRRFPSRNGKEIELVCQCVDDANQNLGPLRDGF